MTNPYSAGGGPVADGGWHAGQELLAGYVAGSVGGAVARSVEAHLTACARCRAALAEHADPGRLARSRSELLVRVAVGDGGWICRLLRHCGVPDHLVRLLAATPSLRRSWLLSILGVLAVITGETVLVRYGWGGVFMRYPGQEMLVLFVLAAPLLALASVAAAFMPLFDPAYLLAAAAPFSSFTLMLVRVISALVAAVIPVACAAFAVPGPGWLPAAFLLPSLAVCAVALVAVTVVRPLAAAIAAGIVWALPVLALAVAHLPLTVIEWQGQAAAAALLLAAASVLILRRDRFDFGWIG